MEKDKFRKFLSGKDLKLTKERSEILSEVMATAGHFDPEELFIKLRAKGSKVSRASVYRTIPLLMESGMLEQVERVDRHAHYEKTSEKKHHDHMICLNCGKVIEFYSSALETLQDKICKQESFKGIRHTLEIFGYCKKCSGA